MLRRRGVGWFRTATTTEHETGVFLILLGPLLDVGVLYIVGGILVVVGAVPWILGAMGRAIGPRAHYW